LKTDFENRPLYVAHDNHIFLETFSPIYQQAYDFLIAIAEPVARAISIHEYHLTSYSLFAAVSIGLKTGDIIDVLERLSKNQVPAPVLEFVRQCTQSYGKVKLVLQKNRYSLESPYPEVLKKLLSDATVREAALNKDELHTMAAPTKIKISGGMIANMNDLLTAKISTTTNLSTAAMELHRSQLAPVDQALLAKAPEVIYAIEIANDKVTTVKQRCIELDFPTLEEYDFRNDVVNPNLNIDLKPTARVRPYQEKCLNKMFSSGRARSGVIVLPCGAGKTLVGITACCTIKKNTVVVCNSAVSVEQWK
jgi:DNA excision repair protein ERCC-3